METAFRVSKDWLALASDPVLESSWLFRHRWKNAVPLAIMSANSNDTLSLVLDKFIDRGEDVANARFYDISLTPLHIAGQLGRSDAVALLLEMGVVSVTKDDYGQTPLHRACRNNHVHTAGILLRAARQHREFWGWPPMYYNLSLDCICHVSETVASEEILDLLSRPLRDDFGLYLDFDIHNGEFNLVHGRPTNHEASISSFSQWFPR